ncbi:Uncharacterized protein Adt_45539 [Abeliophyllum distichum]|uniref:Uncharacterized protein n=1 Tax=Abeliophyllum distichum TaxID=126358 RepID=A0ABD1PEQ7_9LAMI
MLGETPVLSFEQWLEDMIGRKIVEAMSRKSGRQQSLVSEEDLFTPEVIVVPLPRDFVEPKMEKYDRAFSSTLRRETGDCVATLLPKSIHTFDDSSKQFTLYFASSKRSKKKAIGLMQLTQDKDKMLKDFIARFNRPP